MSLFSLPHRVCAVLDQHRKATLQQVRDENVCVAGDFLCFIRNHPLLTKVKSKLRSLLVNSVCLREYCIEKGAVNFRKMHQDICKQLSAMLCKLRSEVLPVFVKEVL